MTSKYGHSSRALSSQNVTCGPPRKVKQSGSTSLAIFASFSAALYVSVVDVNPTMLGFRLPSSPLKSSNESLSAWQSITSTSYWFFSKTAAKYPKPKRAKGKCPVDPLGAGGFTRVTCGCIFLLPNVCLSQVHETERLNVLQNRHHDKSKKIIDETVGTTHF